MRPMDFLDLQNVSALDDAQYRTFVDWLKQHFSEKFRHAKNEPQNVRAAVTAYRAYCQKVGLSSGEFTDFFRVDTPCILDRAGIPKPRRIRQ